MKNLFRAFLMLAFVSFLFTSCTAEDLNDEQNTELATGHGDSVNSGEGTPPPPPPPTDGD